MYSHDYRTGAETYICESCRKALDERNAKLDDEITKRTVGESNNKRGSSRPGFRKAAWKAQRGLI